MLLCVMIGVLLEAGQYSEEPQDHSPSTRILLNGKQTCSLHVISDFETNTQNLMVKYGPHFVH